MRLAKISRTVAAFGAISALLLVSVPAASAQSAGWQQGPGAILDNTYDGFIDGPRAGASVPSSGGFTVAGWFVDHQAQGWAGADDIEVWLGTMDGGGHMLAKANIAQSRPDVASATGNPYWAASGFGAVVNGASVPGGNQTLYVYAHTGGKGWWWKSVSVVGGGAASAAAPAPAAGAAPAPAPAPAASAPAAGGAPVIQLQTPTENQNVSTRSTFTVQGTVSDPTHIDRIEVWINGERDSGSLLGTTTPGSDGSWSVTFNPTKFQSTHTNLYVYAHSSTTRLETEMVVGINIVDRAV
jgi:hypothetical protein